MKYIKKILGINFSYTFLIFLEVWTRTESNWDYNDIFDGGMGIYDSVCTLFAWRNGDESIWYVQWKTLQYKLVSISDWIATNASDIYNICTTIGHYSWHRKYCVQSRNIQKGKFSYSDTFIRWFLFQLKIFLFRLDIGSRIFLLYDCSNYLWTHWFVLNSWIVFDKTTDNKVHAILWSQYLIWNYNCFFSSLFSSILQFCTFLTNIWNRPS